MNKEKHMIGRVEHIGFPELGLFNVAARIDTGAKRSAIWVSRAEVVDGDLCVVFFDQGAPGYTGEVVKFTDYSRIAIASSNGHIDKRFAVRLQVSLGNRKIRATFTLANRSTQVYPVLVGRNVLRGKFIVDVQSGKPLLQKEKERVIELENILKHEGSAL
jgi:hypothetical protein